jgi:hypothetical protein
MSLSTLMTALLASLLAALERKPARAIKLMQAADTTREPEILVYFARHFSRIGKTDLAIHALQQAAENGFLCAPQTLNADAWLHPLHQHPAFASVLKDSENRIHQAQAILASNKSNAKSLAP